MGVSFAEAQLRCARLMHMSRIHVLVDPLEREEFRAQAKREGRSLSDWLREAGRERLARAHDRQLLTPADLQEFFAELDARRGDERPEEDWDSVKRRVAAARTPELNN